MTAKHWPTSGVNATMPNAYRRDYGNLIESIKATSSAIDEHARQLATELACATNNKNAPEMRRVAMEWLTVNIHAVRLKHILADITRPAANER